MAQTGSNIVAVADAVTTELNGAPDGTFAQAFTAQRAYLPIFDLKDMADLHVTVVPKGAVVELFDRRANQYDCAIDVAVQKKLSTADLAEIDALMALVEQIADFFRLRQLSQSPPTIWVKTEHSYLFVPDHMEHLDQFTSVLTLTFRVIR